MGVLSNHVTKSRGCVERVMYSLVDSIFMHIHNHIHIHIHGIGIKRQKRLMYKVLDSGLIVRRDNLFYSSEFFYAATFLCQESKG